MTDRREQKAAPFGAMLVELVRSGVTPPPKWAARFADPRDVRAFHEFAMGHGLLGLALTALEQSDLVAGLTEARRAQLLKPLAILRRQASIWDLERDRLMALLSVAKLDAVLLKGGALRTTVYKEAVQRPIGDLDILVTKENVDRSVEVMKAAGYHVPYTEDVVDAFQEHHFHLRLVHKNGFIVEVHWDLTQEATCFPLDGARVHERAMPAGPGRPYRIPTPEDMILHLATQNVEDSFTTLRRFVDLDRVVRNYPDLDWDALSTRARASGTNNIAMLALQISHRLLNTPIPRDLPQRMGVSRLVRSHLAMLEPAAKLVSNAGTRPSAAILLEWLCAPGLRPRARLMRDHLVQRREAHLWMFEGLEAPEGDEPGLGRGALVLGKVFCFQVSRWARAALSWVVPGMDRPSRFWKHHDPSIDAQALEEIEPTPRIPAKPYLLELFRHQKKLVVRYFMTAIGRAFLAMLAIFLIEEFLSGVLGNDGGLAGMVADRFGAQSALGVVAVLLAATYIGSSLFNYDNRVTQQRMIKVLELGMMERLIRHLLGLSASFFDRQSHGDIIQAVRQDVSDLRSVILGFGRMGVESFQVAGLLFAALWISPSLTFWGLIVLPFAVVPVYLVARKTLRRSYNVRRTGYVLFDVILQLLRGIRVIKTYRGEEAEATAAVDKGRQFFDELVEMVRIQSLANVALESIASLGVVVVVVVGGLQVMQGSLEWPALVAFLLALRALHGPINNVNTAYVEIQQFGAALGRIQALLEERPEVEERENPLRLPTAPDVIRFKDVGFEYNEQSVLSGLNFEIRAGETLGIAGPTGVGKSTLLNLVARFYDPTAGAVFFGDHDLRDYKLNDIYDKIGLVSQEPFLFDMSIRENIRAGRADATDAEVERAARDAEILDEILEMDEGLDTVVGIGGRKVSTGQAQRISIARALLKNAPILILDEATSSLDAITEARVQAAIDRLIAGRTTFVVAHRLSTLQSADRLLVLEGGKVEAFGTLDEVLETSELFKDMWMTQRLQTTEPAPPPFPRVREA